MDMKGILQKIIGKRRASTARGTETQKGLNHARTEVPSGQMTVLTEKDLEGVQGGESGYFLKYPGND